MESQLRPLVSILIGSTPKILTNMPRSINEFSAVSAERLAHEVKTVFSAVRSTIDLYDAGRFCFRRTVYPKATSNAQKSPFYAVFMAFYQLMFVENLSPAPGNKIMEGLKDLTNRIEIGQKHIKGADRQNNIKVTKGLIRDQFVATDVASLKHGPSLIFDFENSIRPLSHRDPAV